MVQGQEESIVYEGQIKVPYNWAVGKTGSFFLNNLKDKKQLWATACNECAKVFLPPRSNCPRCFLPETRWVQLTGKGVLTTYTVIRESDPLLHEKEAPFAYGVIKPDGADTGLVHYIKEVDFDSLYSGMRVEPVFKKDREGHILDISYFRPENLQQEEGN